MAAFANRAFTASVIDLRQSEDGWLGLRAPAKVNLMLSVHGRRADGFHELTSLVAPLAFGDELEIRVNGLQADTLASRGAEVPQDESNLVLRAARLFREQSGRSECFDFRLEKRIPVGAGLGGGSSDAVAALKGMDALLGTGLGGGELRALASSLGSDCPFFVDAAPVVMRGRGEVLEPLDPAASRRLSGQALVLFRPPFGVDTGWAYGRLASTPGLYESHAAAEGRLQAYYAGESWDQLLHNAFESIVGRKFLAIPCLLEILRERGFKCMMSGSGSACFALVDHHEQAGAINELGRACWGPGMFWVETSLADGKI